RCRAADRGRRFELIGRTRRGRSRALLRQVARTVCRPANRRARLELHAAGVAVLVQYAQAGRAWARRRAIRIGFALILDFALRVLALVGSLVAGIGAAVHVVAAVARSSSRTDSVAAYVVDGAELAVIAGRAVRNLLIGRTLAGVAGAGFGDVTVARRRAADG